MRPNFHGLLVIVLTEFHCIMFCFPLCHFLMLFFCYFQGALYVLLNNRMLFLIVHYWEVMVDVWPVIVQVRICSKLCKTASGLPQFRKWLGKN